VNKIESKGGNGYEVG